MNLGLPSCKASTPSCRSISPTWIRLAVAVQPGCTNLGLRTLFHSRPMPTVTAALVGATLGQTFNRNRALLPLVHAITVGEHTAKVNSCWRATAAERNAPPGSYRFILLFGALDIAVG